MNESKLNKLMLLLIVIGVTLIITGLYIAVFTDVVSTKGVNGILLIAGLIAGGLFISVPAKIFLTLQLMKYNDKKLSVRNQTNNEN